MGPGWPTGRAPSAALLGWMLLWLGAATVAAAAPEQPGPLARSPHAAQPDQALIILRDSDPATIRESLAAIQAGGGRVQHVLSSRCLIASLPTRAETGVAAARSVAALHRDLMPASAAAGDAELATARCTWNHLRTMAAMPPPPPQDPLHADALLPPPEIVPMATAPTSHLPGFTQTSEFLIGKVAVGVILPESIGGAENWTPERQARVFDQIVAGLNWWVNRGGTAAYLTFYYDRRFSVPTQYEPVTRSGWSDEGVWVSDIFANMGYASGDQYNRARSYLNDLRNSLRTDWCFAIIVADSLNDPDGKFADGVYFAWSWLGGPYFVMTYDNNGYGIDRMHQVVTHETGHTFLAADEYCSPGYACCDFGTYGYLGIVNANCESGNPSSVPCVMRRIEDAICSHTQAQLGWRDTDADGLPDTVDNAVTNALNPAQTPTSQTQLTYTGMAVDVPCPSPQRTAVTINRIAAVSFRVDGGVWTAAMPTEGAFDTDAEAYVFTTGVLTPGAHVVESLAVSTSGNVSPIARQEVMVSQPPAVLTDLPAIIVSENGSAVFRVRLSQAPPKPVTVNVARFSGDTDITVQSAVTVVAADDADARNGLATIRCTAGGYAASDVVATEDDDEIASDFDGDADVDLADFSMMEPCFNGPNRPPPTSLDCGAIDLDGDADVDLAEFKVFQDCFNGPNQPPLCA